MGCLILYYLYIQIFFICICVLVGIIKLFFTMGPNQRSLKTATLDGNLEAPGVKPFPIAGKLQRL